MHNLQEHLSYLEVRDLITLTRSDPDSEYLFRHALIRDAAYSSLLRKERSHLHLSAAQALQAAYPDRLDELAPRLAYHYEQAGSFEQAGRYYQMAAATALAQFANVEAEGFLRAALAHIQSDEDRLNLLIQLGTALARQSKFDQSAEIRRQAIQLAHERGDSDQAASLYADLSRTEWWRFDFATGQKVIDEGLTLLKDAPETAGLGRLLHEAARNHNFNDEGNKALPLCEQALAIAERLGDIELQVDTRATLGYTLFLLGKPHESIALMKDGLELAQSIYYSHTSSRLHNNLASIQRGVGYYAEARPHLLKGVEIGRRRGFVTELAFMLNNLADLDIWLGCFQQAEDSVNEARSLTASVGLSAWSLVEQSMITALHRYYGNHQQALDEFPRVIAALVAARDRSYTGMRMLQYGELLMEMSYWDEACHVLHEKMAFGDQTSDMLNASPLSLLSTILAVQGQLNDAHTALDQAHQDAGTDTGAAVLPISAAYIAQAEARLAMLEGRFEDSAHHFADAERLFAAMGWRWYRAQTLMEWADVLLLLRHDDRALARLREAKAEFEAMQAAYYAAKVEQRLSAVLVLAGSSD